MFNEAVLSPRLQEESRYSEMFLDGDTPLPRICIPNMAIDLTRAARTI